MYYLGWTILGLFFVYFHLFKPITILTTNICEKMLKYFQVLKRSRFGMTRSRKMDSVFGVSVAIGYVKIDKI